MLNQINPDFELKLALVQVDESMILHDDILLSLPFLSLVDSLLFCSGLLMNRIREVVENTQRRNKIITKLTNLNN